MAVDTLDPNVGEVRPRAPNTHTGPGTHPSHEMADADVETEAVHDESAEGRRPSKRARRDDGIENSVGGDGESSGGGGTNGELTEPRGGAGAVSSDVGGDVGRRLANLIKGHHAALRKVGACLHD